MRSNSKLILKAQEKLLAGIGVPEITTFSADPFQLAAIDSLLEGSDTLVIAPTGTGKTYIAVEAIRKILASQGRAVYTAPLKALSNTKFTEFKSLFEPQHKVGLLTGDRKIDPDADLVVATTEIYRNDLYGLRCEYSLVVLDELHYLADSQRGPVWEESIILSPRNSTLLMLSASISNPHEIASWIESVRGRKVTVIIERHRRVDLRLGFLHPDLGVLPLQDEKGRIFEEVTNYYSEGMENRRGRPGARGRNSTRGRYSSRASRRR